MVRQFTRILIVFGFLTASGQGQQALNTPADEQQTRDIRESVVPIITMRFYGPAMASWMGTGFCLDPACQFVVTNYHVAVLAKPKRIAGEKIVQQQLATSDQDAYATPNVLASDGRTLKFVLSKDLAIFKLRGPLPHHHGVDFQTRELGIGDEVEIYAYPKEGVLPIPVRELLKFHGRFQGETEKGLLVFDYGLAEDKGIRPGASGGVVVDSTGKVVGVLSAIAMDQPRIALAVPVRSLAEFVAKAQPLLARRIFPAGEEIPAESADLYPKLVLPPHSGELERRPEEPLAVRLLRSKVQATADHMYELVAVQTFAWGSEKHPPIAEKAYEVRFVDGDQRFREYPNGTKELEEVPYPARLGDAVKTRNAWSALLLLIGTEFGLKIQEAGDTIVEGHKIRVFHYRGDPEDGACRFRHDVDLGLFQTSKTYSVGCYGEVWTDEDLNVLRLSQHLELPGKWKDYEVVLTYGWLRKEGEAARLVPVSISTQAEYNHKVYWCRGRFMNYQVFRSQVKMVTVRTTRKASYPQ